MKAAPAKTHKRVPTAATRAERAAGIKGEDPVARWRIDLAIESIGDVNSDSTTTRLIMRGDPPKIPAIGWSQAADYLERAFQEIQSEIAKDRAHHVGKAIQHLRNIERKALRAGEFGASMAAADRLGLHLKTSSALNASKTIHVTDQPQETVGLTTEELEALLLAETKKRL